MFSHRYMLSLCNSHNSVESDVVSQCVPGSIDMITMIGNDMSSPRSVILNIDLTAINLINSATPTHTICSMPTPSPSPPTLQDVENIVGSFSFY